MKNTIIFSTITGGIINFSSPGFTKTDSFGVSTITNPGELVYTYKTITPCTTI
jgi:hypothetical protein